MPKVMIIGLDGGTFDLIRPWADEGKLPNIARLMRSGASGNLKSTLPPMTFPAWNAFMTGQNPGKHGVFDFMERRSGTYELEIMNAGHRKCETIWKIASRAGKRCAAIGVPVTYPPEEINGVMISGFDAPFLDERIMYPRGLFNELKDNVGEYIVSASFSKHLKAGALDKAIEAILAAIDRKADTARYILEREKWDLFMIVFGETDAAIHCFWKYHDKNSPQRNSLKKDRFDGDPIFEVYKRIDLHIGKLLELISKETTVIVMSDHGAGGAGVKFIYPNIYLELHGLLRFKNLPLRSKVNKFMEGIKASVRVVLPKRIIKYLRFNPKGMGLKWESRLRFSYIDWKQTEVYAEETPYYPNMRINLKGREPDGIVEQCAYEDVIARTITLLNEWTDPNTGEKVVRNAYRKEDIYHGDYLEKAPDIIISWNYDNGYSYLSRPSFMSKANLPIEKLDAMELETSDFMINRSGSHREDGIFIMMGSSVNSDAVVEGGISIMDIAPTVLYLLDMPIPEEMDGRALLSCFRGDFLRPLTYEHSETSLESPYHYSDGETDEIKKKLEGLGYL